MPSKSPEQKKLMRAVAHNAEFAAKVGIPQSVGREFYEADKRKARRESMTLRDLYNLVAAARGHWVLCGSPETVADTLQLWFDERAADGFNIMPPYFPEGFCDFVDLVVPILQERGLFRREYDGVTLRDHLGLTRPRSRFFG